MERILEDHELAAALRLAHDGGDGPALMRLTGIRPEQVACNRFWFGFRDANVAFADTLRAV